MIRGLPRAPNPDKSIGTGRRTQGKPEIFNSGFSFSNRSATKTQAGPRLRRELPVTSHTILDCGFQIADWPTPTLAFLAVVGTDLAEGDDGEVAAGGLVAAGGVEEPVVLERAALDGIGFQQPHLVEQPAIGGPDVEAVPGLRGQSPGRDGPLFVGRDRREELIR